MQQIFALNSRIIETIILPISEFQRRFNEFKPLQTNQLELIAEFAIFIYQKLPKDDKQNLPPKMNKKPNRLLKTCEESPQLNLAKIHVGEVPNIRKLFGHFDAFTKVKYCLQSLASNINWLHS